MLRGNSCSLTLIIPAFNEEHFIKESVERNLAILENSGIDFEIIVVDNGSQDRTRQILDDFFQSHPKIKIIEETQVRGFGSAVKAGIKLASKDWILFVAVDGPLTKTVFDAFLSRLGQADILVSHRVVRRGYSTRMKINSKIYHFLISLLFGMHLKDYNWIQLYRRQIFNEIQVENNYIFMLAEILIKAKWKGYKLLEFQVDMETRKGGQATAATYKAAILTLIHVLKFFIQNLFALHSTESVPKNIKFVDIQKQFIRYKQEFLSEIERVCLNGDFILGQTLEEFESAFARYVGCKFAVGVGTGTAALVLSVRALDINKGDEVITVPNSFIATAFAITENAATPVFVDVDLRTQLMDVTQLEAVITPHTKAIIPVHLFGQMADMKAIMKIASKYGLYVIEDACQAHGATQFGKRSGSLGNLGCFSFYPGKNLGAFGDGGIITTNDEILYKKLKLLRNFGSEKKYFHQITGDNTRLDTLQAAVLNVKLKYLEQWNKRREEISSFYQTALKGTGDLILPTYAPGNQSCHHLFVVRTHFRDALFEHLNARGIQCVIHYPIPIHLQKAYEHLNLKPGSFPVTEQLAHEILSLPIHPEMTDSDAQHVVQEVCGFFENLDRIKSAA